MKKHKMFIIMIYAIFIYASHLYAEEKSILLKLGPADRITGSNLNNGKAVNLKGGEFIIIGTVESADFSIAGPAQIRLYDGAGKVIPLIVDKSSLYSEFGDEINSLRIQFKLSDKQIKAGSPRLVWGKEIKETNQLVEKITVYKGSISAYRSFTIQEGAGQSNDSNFATIDVIVDDYADKYYLWYLFPVIILLVFLTYRKYRTAK